MLENRSYSPGIGRCQPTNDAKGIGSMKISLESGERKKILAKNSTLKGEEKSKTQGERELS